MMNSIKEEISDKWFYPLILIMGIYLIVRLVNQAKLLWIFPFDYTNDLSSYMALLHFLAKYGFHNIAPEWYGGLVVLKFYSPGWFYFALPIYWVTKNVQTATYVSLVFLYAIAGLSVHILGRIEGWSKTKRTAFFLLIFGNAIAIGTFIRLGAMPYLFAFAFFIGFFALIMKYKGRRLDRKFCWYFIPLLAIMIVGHAPETLLSGILILSFLLTSKDKLKIIIASLASMLLTSFWWIPFIRGMGESNISHYVYTETLLDFSGPWAWTNVMAIVIPIAAIIAFYVYWRQKSTQKNDLLFFLPVGILGLLVITTVVKYIPFFNQVYPDSYIMFFAVFTVYFFFKIKHINNRYIKTAAILALLVFPVLSVGVSHFHTPYFSKNSQLSLDVLDMLSSVQDTYLIIGVPAETAYAHAFYSYGAIYLNIKTASGWSGHEMSPERRELLYTLWPAFDNRKCKTVKELLAALNVKEVISYSEGCSFLADCGFKRYQEKNGVCLYRGL